MGCEYARATIDGRRVYVHRYMMERHLGRELRHDEHVHHRNGDRWLTSRWMASPWCAECGCPHDERTRGCGACGARHRRRKGTGRVYVAAH